MSRITVEEFEVCHQFMQNCVQYNLPLHERKFVNLTHLVSCDDFVIFVSCDENILEVRLNNLFEL